MCPVLPTLSAHFHQSEVFRNQMHISLSFSPCLWREKEKKKQLNSRQTKTKKNPKKLQSFQRGCKRKRGGGVGKHCFGVFFLLGSTTTLF